MKTNNKVSGQAASAILERLSQQLEDFYCELDELRYAVSRQVQWLKKLQSEASCLLDGFDPEQDVDPSIVEQISDLLGSVDSIPSDVGELAETLQALYEVSKQFYDAKDDWDALLDEASSEDGVVESES